MMWAFASRMPEEAATERAVKDLPLQWIISEPVTSERPMNRLEQAVHRGGS